MTGASPRSSPRRVGSWTAGLILVVLLPGVALGASASAAAAPSGDLPPTEKQSPSGVASSSLETEPTVASPDGRQTLERLPVNLCLGVIGVFHRDSALPLLLGGATAGGASFFDGDLSDAVGNPDSSFGKSVYAAGGTPAAVVTVGLFATGRLVHGPTYRAMTYDLLDAVVVNGGYVQLLKLIVGRERPDGSNHKSLPSGHSSNAFAMATVVEFHYGWKAGAPAYVLAGAIGASTIVHDKHYLSDAVAGATLGYIVGRTVVRANGRPLERAPGRRLTWSLSPRVTRSEYGFRLAATF